VANILVSATSSNVNVSTTRSNVVVTDSDTGTSINVTTTASNINVTSAVSNITVSQGVAVSNTEIRAAIGNVFPILYDSVNGIISIDEDAINIANAILNGNITLRQFQETVYAHGNVATGTLNANISNGTIHTVTLTGNLSQINFSNISTGGSALIILKQDPIGHRNLITSGSSWNDWEFVGGVETIGLDPNTYSAISVTYDGSKYFAAVATFGSTLIENSALANSNIIINGQTFALGSSGNITNFLANITMQQNLTVAGTVTANTILSNGAITANGAISANGTISTNLDIITPQLYLGPPNTGGLKYITAWGLGTGGSPAAGQLIYDGTSGFWKFTNDTEIPNLFFKLPTSTTDLNEGSNLYFTNARVRAAVSAFDNGGDGSFSYDNSTGQFTYTGPSQAEANTRIDARLSGTSPIQYSSGVISLSSTANITTTGNIQGGNLIATTNVSVAGVKATGNISGNYFLGNGSLLTGLPTPYSNASVANFLANGYGSNNITTTGVITAGTLTATANIITTPANAVITGDTTTDDLHIQYDQITLAIDNSTIGDDSLRVINARDGNVLFQVGPDLTNLSPDSGVRIAGDLYVGTDNPANITGTFRVRNNTGDVDIKGGLFALQQIRTDSGGQAIYAHAGNIETNYYFLGNGRFITGITTNSVTEGTNLYWTTDRGNTNSNAWLTTKTTTDLAEGTNLYFTAARARGNISVAENLTYNSSTGVIGMANSLANVNSIITETTANATVTADEMLEFKARKRNNTLVSGANIHAEGFAVTQGANFFNAPIFSKTSGTGQLKSYVFDATITSGSNVMTVSAIYDMQGVAASVSDVSQYYMFLDYPLIPSTTAFPPGTYVTSVSGSNIYMSANATRSDTFVYDGGDPYASYGGLSPAAYDSTTGLLIGFESEYDDGGASAQTITYNYLSNPKNLYGYGAGGPVTTDFAYSRDSAANYSINTTVLNQFLTGRTNFSAKQTVGNFRRGLTIGDADLTNRGENDGLQTFGLGVVWDGTANVTADYGTSGIFPQILLKQYTTGTNQGLSATALTNSGPRMLFIGANGKNTDAALGTYARNNQEVGRITWLSTTDFSTEPSTTTPPAFISVISNRDQTGTGPNDFGMYLVTSPSAINNQRAMWAGHYKANTIISAGSRSAGTSGNIIFAPARQTTNANTQLHPESIVNSACASPHWATIGYDNPAANTGARISVTNGNNAAAARNGNLTLALSRNSNFGVKEWALKVPSGNSLVLTEDGVIRTTFAAANITTAGNISAGYFLGDGSQLTNVSATAFGTIAVAGQSNVVADSSNDLLTFVAGSGMTITTDSATDTITFTSTGGYGNVEVANFLANGYGSNTISTTGNITAGNTIVNGVSFNTAGTTSPNAGEIVYNSNYGAHQQGLNGSNVIIMGQDLVAYVNNAEANTLLKGEVVYIYSATGDKASVKRALNTSDATSGKTLGIVKSDIAAGALGYVTTQGVVNGLNLGSYTAGDSLYLSNVAGTFTNVKPSAPEHIVFIGVVEKANAGNGQVLVRVQNGYELNEIHDVKLNGVQQNDILVRNSGNTLWVNQNFGTTVTSSNLTLKQFQETKVDLGSTGGNITLNMANGSIFTMTATSNISNIALSNAGVGASGTLIITQDSTGSRLLTVTSAWKFASGSKTLTTTANAIDIVNFFTDGTTVYAALSKGYS
jgi:hypothetical protein